MFGAGILSAAVISRLPRERIVRSRLRETFFLGWSVADLSLMIMATFVDGGTASPIALFLFIPVVFSALSYPLARSSPSVASALPAFWLSPWRSAAPAGDTRRCSR
jgi:hypothetical protein